MLFNVKSCCSFLLAKTGYKLEKESSPLVSPFTKKSKLYALKSFSEAQQEKLTCHYLNQNAEVITEDVVSKILTFFESVPPFYTEELCAPLRVAGAWRQQLLRERKEQLHYIEKQDHNGLKKLLNQMFFNELMSGLWNHTRNSRNFFLPLGFLYECQMYEQLTSRSVSDLAVTKNLAQWGMIARQGVVRMTDPQHGIQAHYITKLLQQIPNHQPLHILDLGSGFGGLAEKLLNVEHLSNVKLFLIDIPLNLTTAYAFLISQFPHKKIRLVKREDELRQAEDADITLIPTAFVEEASETYRFNLIHNGKSFSEMDHETVAFYLEHCISEETYFVIDTNSNLPGSENSGAFCESLARDFPYPDFMHLMMRYPDIRPGRYVTSVYCNRYRMPEIYR